MSAWSDEKAGQYLAVFLTSDAKAFYHQQPESVRKSYKELSGALKERYEGGLALLKYKKVFNCRSSNNGESLHSYLSELRLAYERAYSPPKVDPLPEEASTEQKNEKLNQEGALSFYNKRKNDDILCQFINGLDKDLKEMLIRQDDLLPKPVESVLKQISTLEEEQGVNRKVAAAAEMPAERNVRQSDLEGIVKKTVEEKLEEMLKKAAVVKKGGRRVGGKARPGPKPTDICRACKGQGHWPRSCPSLNRKEDDGSGP